MALPFVSIIIPTYNRLDLLKQTVQTFLDQSYPADRYEIIVSDNNSTDKTAELVRELTAAAGGRVSYLCERRQGVHFARNTAAKSARGDILYFTDDDMVADRELIAEIVKVFDLDPRIGCATGKILPQFQCEPPAWVRRCLANSYLSLTENDKAEALIVSREDLVFSCHQAIRRELFFLAGGFNPENTCGTWVGDGETGLNIKIKSLGCLFAYTEKSVIRHVIPPERTTLRYLVKRIGNQGYCDAYTEYREHRSFAWLLRHFFVGNSLGVLLLLAKTCVKIALGMECWQFIPARMVYSFNMMRYEMRLLRDPRFRKVVEIDDWIANDTEQSPYLFLVGKNPFGTGGAT